MTKTKKQEHLSPEEVKHQISEEAEQKIDKTVAEEIEVILKNNNRALQPFIQYTDVASIARVRLVRNNPDAEKEVNKVN